MNINILLYNILFIIILVLLIYLFIYINNKYIENFVDGVATSTTTGTTTGTTSGAQSLTSNSPITNAGTLNARPLEPYVYVRKPWEYIGKEIDTSVPSAEYLQCYYDIFKAIPEAGPVTPFKSGYYWINFGDYVVGNTSSQTNNKYCYCLLDKNIAGGGWILAMRGVKGSKTFHYNSPYWTSMGPLNDNSTHIKNTIGYQITRDTNGREVITNEDVINQTLNTVSSIGNLIYTSTDAANHDAKFEAFDKYPAKEWLVIFYINEGTQASNKKGGDYDNNRGWIWHETNLPRNAQNRPYTAREIFNGAHVAGRLNNQGVQISSELQLSVSENYGGSTPNVDIRNLKKFYKNYNGSGIPTPAIWSKQNGYNWYGINYQHNSTFNNKECRLMRLGMTFSREGTRGNNRVIGGIGLNYDGTTAIPPNTPLAGYENTGSFSAGNFVLRYTGEDATAKYRELDNTITSSGINLGNGDEDTSFAFEFYVK